jgi:DNA repair exonuclease SbcCD nuclease subunit
VKYVVFADLHLSGKDSEYVDLDGKKYPRKEYFTMTNMWNALEDFKSRYPKEQKNLIIAGDVFHHKNYAHASSKDLLSQFLSFFNDWNIYILAGNHDVSDKTEKPITLFSDLKYNHNKNLVILEPGECEILENKILLLPWSKNFLDVLKDKIENNKIEVLISHFGINEAVLNSGLSHIDRVAFKDLSEYFKTIILGHYHKPQILRNDRSKLIYVGSVVQENWGESGDEKRYIIYDSETDDYESIPTLYPKYILCETDDIEIINNKLKEKSDEDSLKVKTKDEKIYNFCQKNKINCCLINPNEESNNDEIKTIDLSKNIYVEYLKYKKIDESLHDVYLEKLTELIGS